MFNPLNKTIMERVEKALELLHKKITSYNFEDDIYTLVNDIIYDNVREVEKEVGEIEPDDDVEWYDDDKEELFQELCARIGKWLTGE